MNKLQLVRMYEVAKIVPRFSNKDNSDNDLVEIIQNQLMNDKAPSKALLKPQN
jgi:hypothetical protein